MLLHSLELRTGPPEEPCVLLHKGSFEDPAWQVLRERFLKAGEAEFARISCFVFTLMRLVAHIVHSVFSIPTSHRCGVLMTTEFGPLRIAAGFW